jgi:hypothetical protein
MEKQPTPNVERMMQIGYDIQKKQNILEYGKDIVMNIERMSLNKVVLQRKYYIAVSYHISEAGLTNKYSREETLDLAYSELYTRAKSIQNALLSAGVDSHVLDSNELGELLYMAFNRDDSEFYSLKKALDSGFYRLYSTSKDVRLKRHELDEKLKVNQALDEAAAAKQVR